MNSIDDRQALPDRLEPQPGYNFPHFRTGHLLADAVRTVQKTGVHPGEAAPDFELPTSTGERVRLSDLRGAPVVLHFGSLT